MEITSTNATPAVDSTIVGSVQKEKVESRKRLRGGFGAGVGAALFMLLIMVLLRFTSNTASIPELMEDQLILWTGGEANSFFINNLGTGGKALLLVLISEGTLLLGGLLGTLFARFWPTRIRLANWKWISALAYGLALGFFLNVAFLPIMGHGFFGMSALQVTAPPDISLNLYGSSLAPWGFTAWLNMIVLGMVFSVFLVRLLPWPTTAPAPGMDSLGDASAPQSEERRGVLKALGGTLVAIVGGAALWGVLGRALQAPQAAGVVEDGIVTGGAGGTDPVFDTSKDDTGNLRPTPEPAAGEFGEVKPLLVPEITPTDTFYVTTKNYIDPTVQAATWTLAFKGLVDNPFTLNYDDIKALPAELRTHTLACISNPVGGSLIGNGRWLGVSFADLLKRAGPQSGAVDIIVRGADGYTDSFTVDAGLNNNGLLAYEMNGAPLNQKHGYPLRLLIPAIFGMKNVKWITEVELVDHDYKGYWQKQGWSDPAPYLTMSRIDYPDRGSVEAGPIFIGGIAFAGERGIERVEVSTDDGRTWTDAQVRPPLGVHTWNLWTYAWNPEPGNYTIKCRATDRTGAVQTDRQANTFPDGATGYHSRKIRIDAASGGAPTEKIWGKGRISEENFVPVLERKQNGQ